MAVKPKPQREAPAPQPLQSRMQLGRNMAQLAGLKVPAKKAPKGK